jgi:hypothetical protein
LIDDGSLSNYEAVEASREIAAPYWLPKRVNDDEHARNHERRSMRELLARPFHIIATIDRASEFSIASFQTKSRSVCPSVTSEPTF